MKPVVDPDMSPKGLMSAVSKPILCWGEEESPAEPEHSGSSFLAAGRVGSAFSCVCVFVWHTSGAAEGKKVFHAVTPSDVLGLPGRPVPPPPHPGAGADGVN